MKKYNIKLKGTYNDPENGDSEETIVLRITAVSMADAIGTVTTGKATVPRVARNNEVVKHKLLTKNNYQIIEAWQGDEKCGMITYPELVGKTV